jgi:hypothetical protein
MLSFASTLTTLLKSFDFEFTAPRTKGGGLKCRIRLSITTADGNGARRTVSQRHDEANVL